MTGMSSFHSRKQWQQCKIKVSIRSDIIFGRSWAQDNRKKTSTNNECNSWSDIVKGFKHINLLNEGPEIKLHGRGCVDRSRGGVCYRCSLGMRFQALCWGNRYQIGGGGRWSKSSVHKSKAGERSVYGRIIKTGGLIYCQRSWSWDKSATLFLMVKKIFHFWSADTPSHLSAVFTHPDGSGSDRKGVWGGESACRC